MTIRAISQVTALLDILYSAPASARANLLSFDYPGAINTKGTSINPPGDIVEGYTSADGLLHGFILSNGKFSSIEFPSATPTEVDRISQKRNRPAMGKLTWV